jgi:hypothetical protein
LAALAEKVQHTNTDRHKVNKKQRSATHSRNRHITLCLHSSCGQQQDSLQHTREVDKQPLHRQPAISQSQAAMTV